MHRDRAAIVAARAGHSTPFARTWSCDKGGKTHCGRCCPCVQRREAFDLACSLDPTADADPDFWRVAVAADQKA